MRPRLHSASMQGVADLLRTASVGKTAKWLEMSVVIAGAAIAFLLGYLYAAAHPLEGTWAQTHMGAAVNYACTGRFGPIRLAPDATAADAAALAQVETFLRVDCLDLSCASVPQHVVATGFFHGIGATNTEQPTYVILSYALLWRLFGLHWSLTFYVIGAIVAASYLVVYFCGRPFMPALLAFATTLLFLSSPLFLPHVLSPRDALKFPF